MPEITFVVKPLGADGGVVSGAVAVVAETGDDCAELFPAAS